MPSSRASAASNSARRSASSRLAPRRDRFADAALTLAQARRLRRLVVSSISSSSTCAAARSSSISASTSSRISWIAASRALLIDLGHEVGGEVEHSLQVARRDVEQQTEPARRALDVPDVRDRRGQLDVAHPLAAHLGAGDLDAALVADGAGVANALVLAAVALPVLGRTEDALAEEPAVLRLQRPVVDRLRLGHFTVRPGPDRLRRGQADPDRIEIVDVEHAPAIAAGQRARSRHAGRAHPASTEATTDGAERRFNREHRKISIGCRHCPSGSSLGSRAGDELRIGTGSVCCTSVSRRSFRTRSD